jgi:hypothetical protein
VVSPAAIIHIPVKYHSTVSLLEFRSIYCGIEGVASGSEHRFAKICAYAGTYQSEYGYDRYLHFREVPLHLFSPSLRFCTALMNISATGKF